MALASKLEHTRHTMTGRRFRRWICHGQPSLHTLHRILIDPASRLRSKKEHISVWRLGGIGAQSLRGEIRRGRSEEEGVKGNLGSESKPAAQEDSSLLVLV